MSYFDNSELKTYPLEIAVDHLLAVQIDHALSNASQLQWLTLSNCQE